MTDDELAGYAAAINDEVRGITRARSIIRGIHARLDENAQAPFEQDYVYSMHYGDKPSEPRTKLVNGVLITTRILHQTGARLSDINGADLLYEIPGRKFVTIQYKRASKGGAVSRDQDQLDDLVHNCAGTCYVRSRSRLSCGSWFGVISGGDVRLQAACVADQIFDRDNPSDFHSFASGLSQPAFDELFGKCYLGARTSYGDLLGQVQRVMAAGHLLFSVVERRSTEES